MSFMKLYIGGYLTFFAPDQQSEIDLPLSEGKQLVILLTEMGLPISDVSLVIVNGDIADLHQAWVNPGDMVKIFPAVDGG
jgi:sulfur carrier protein ThiS